MEKSFEGMKIYYSGSIRGVRESDPEFPWKLVSYMIENGADVLSEHVAARTPGEMDYIRARRIGIDVQQMLSDPAPWFLVRRFDLEWVDEATHMIAVVNGSSHGVGMEIQRALDKPRMGLNKTPILCLIREDLLDRNLTFMIRGVSKDECDSYFLKTYKDITDAQQTVAAFLTCLLESGNQT